MLALQNRVLFYDRNSSRDEIRSKKAEDMCVENWMVRAHI